MQPKPKSDLPQVPINAALASTVSQVGCVTVVIVVGALLIGLWLDNWLGTKPILTIGLILVSIPVSLFSLIRIALSAAARIQPPEDSGTPDKGEAA